MTLKCIPATFQQDGAPEQTDPHSLGETSGHASPQPSEVHCADEETWSGLEVPRPLSIKVVEMELGYWLRGQPLPRCVGGNSPTRNAMQLGERNGPGAHWPVGDYLVTSKVEGGEEKRKFPKLAQLAPLAQGGWRFSVPAEPGRDACPSGSPPAPETLGLEWDYTVAALSNLAATSAVLCGLQPGAKGTNKSSPPPEGCGPQDIGWAMPTRLGVVGLLLCLPRRQALESQSLYLPQKPEVEAMRRAGGGWVRGVEVTGPWRRLLNLGEPGRRACRPHSTAPPSPPSLRPA